MAFKGFRERDFQSGVDATNWRKDLGSELRKTMSATLCTYVATYPFPHRPELYIREEFDRRMYDSKLHIGTEEEGLHVGYYVERKLPRDATEDPNKRRGAEDDWPKLIVGLERRGRIREILRDIATAHDLQMRVIVGEKKWQPIGATHLQDAVALDKIHDHLARVPEDPWVDVYIDCLVPKEKALEESAGIASRIVDICIGCWPLYQATLRADYVYDRQ